MITSPQEQVELDILSDILNREAGSEKVLVTKLDDRYCEQVLSEARGAVYIEEVISRYTDEEDPTWCNWQDIEGLDYGWIWTKYKEEHMKEMMIAYISGTVRALQKRISYGEDFTGLKVVVDEDTVVFHVLDIKENQDVYTWTFSSKDTYLA